MVQEKILEVYNLCKYFKIDRKHQSKAVDDVSFFIRKGETLGIVGESGCGKTTCGRTSIGLYKRNSGTVLFHGKEIEDMKGKEKKKFYQKVQMVFQDPYNSLDPKMKVERIVSEGLRIHQMVQNKNEEKEKVIEILQNVGLHGSYLARYAREFSGGQRQRIGIARALAMEPEILVCDEPISALDVSIQAQIMNLLIDLKEEKGLTYIFIAHNLAAVKYISDRIAVMYMGKIVEMGSVEEIYEHPQHPYTVALMAAITVPDPHIERQRKKIILGEVNQIESAGCQFAPRCPYAKEKCWKEYPQMKTIAKDHQVACFL